MRPPSNRLFPNTATFKRRTWSNDRGERVATEEEVTRACNLQRGDNTRVHEQGVEGARASYIVLFPAPDPGVEPGDAMTVTTVAGGTVAMTVTGSANEDVARGVMFVVSGTELR